MQAEKRYASLYERNKEIHYHLYSYAAHKSDIEAYVSRAMRKTGRMNETGIRGSYISDPTARGGVMLAEFPKRLQKKADWVAVIEDAWAECLAEDNGEPHGLAYLMERNFCLTGAPREKKLNEEAQKRICDECGISKSTFFARLAKITRIVEYHATQKGLFRDE